MDIDNYTPNDLKKLFTKGSGINFLNDYTFQDVEDGKKKLFLQLMEQFKSDKDKLKTFLDRAGKKLMEDKITNGFDKPIGVVVKNTVKDNLNPDYKNTIKRLINIDSQYIPLNATSSYVFKLTEKLVNVVSIELTNLQIPMTFYNIESRQGNNFFYIYPHGQVGNLKTVDISDGNYSLETLIPAVHTAIRTQTTFTDISFSIDLLSGKTTFTSTTRYTIEFYEDSMTETTKINHCLGWILGFHKTPTEYENPSLIYDLNTSLTSDKVAYVGTTKNIIVVLDEFSQNQTSGTMIQTINDINTIKPTTYYANSKVPKSSTFSPLNLDCLTPTNINTEDQMKTASTKTGLTRAQIYTRAQVNYNKILVNNQTCYLEANTQNNVLAIVPFETSTSWGQKYFTDKNKYVRQYHGPVEIDKIQVRLYDEKGFEMDFNGANWSVTMITEHLYKY